MLLRERGETSNANAVLALIHRFHELEARRETLSKAYRNACGKIASQQETIQHITKEYDGRVSEDGTLHRGRPTLRSHLRRNLKMDPYWQKSVNAILSLTWTNNYG